MRLIASTLLTIVVAGLAGAAEKPIALHPQNPHYFLWRGQAMALVTSAEHYGAVLNLDFDWRRYLATMEADGMNYTRLFTGSYVEPHGSFGIQRNTLAPKPGRFVAPWTRSAEPGYAGGGNKFDLDRWDPAFLARLREFIGEAGRRGIVVELSLFCSTYTDRQWAVSPFNPTNNINGIEVPHWLAVNTRTNGNLFPHQEKLVRYLVRELNAFDNLIYEIQNEPWSDHHVMGDFINPYVADKYQFPNAVEVTTPVSVDWQSAIAEVIVAAERGLPARHLIAQNIANFRLAVRAGDVAPGVSILNFHYAYPEAVVWNYGLGKLLGYDETGFAGGADATYRREAWAFLLAGGGLFNSLDYSFTVGREDGTDTAPNGPGGGSPALRNQLRVLSRFLHSFDLPALRPDPVVVRRSPGVVARALSTPGRQYALYLRGRSPCELELAVPAGRYGVEWVAVVTGEVVRRETGKAGRGGGLVLSSPAFEEEIALRIRRR